MSAGPFFLTGHAEADQLLEHDRLALLIGMVLDQQVPIEWAFAAPATLRRRLGEGAWTVGAIAAMHEDDLVAAFVDKPALHRFPAAMARRISALCRAIEDRYDGDIEAIWRDVDAATALRRLRALPGFGAEKSRIFLAVLAKKYGVAPPGWVEACTPFGDDQPRTAADIRSPETLAAVRAWKKAQRAAGRSKAD
ncbi:MAG: Fe-S cluster assembly protein HesB [Acidimicrobiales bacterium]|nr:Fe-S cluster assembly protein HesB [Acidimicrobiales bacterium]